MSKAIRSYPLDKQAEVVKRRIQSKTGGLGYLSALAWESSAKKDAP